MEPEVSAINILDELLSYLTTITREDLIGFSSGNEVKFSRAGYQTQKAKIKRTKPRETTIPISILDLALQR